ncbi:MAG: hypothetical protein ACYDCO_00520 [Armatimonadota bacterium]
MPYLLDNRMAPLTWSWGFLESPLEQVCAANRAWSQQSELPITEEAVSGSLEETLRCLTPLTVPPCRELLLETVSGWTACFNNGLYGGDNIGSTVGVLSEKLQCRGVMVTAVPVYSYVVCGGDVGFTLHNKSMDYERMLRVHNDGRWSFHTYGNPQPFEQEESYRARRVRDRFTTDMLGTYCEALGIRLFDPAFYGRKGVVFTLHMKMPPDFPCMSLEEAQRQLGAPR